MSVEHLVIGPPGTGKTTYLAGQATRAAEKVGPDAVMIASLTRAAAQEIAGRDTPIPRRCVGTLHAHAYRVLDKPELAETPDGLAAWNDFAEREGLVWKMGNSAQVNLDYAPEQRDSSQGELLLATMGTLRARQAPRELWPPKVLRFAEAWDAWKLKANRLDFTDLIERALEEVDIPMTMPQIMMLDEAQDLSALEFALARKWSKSCEQIVVVGDPDQCLYAWRGTDPQEMLSGDLASQRVLAQSYRVPAAVHDYAVNWIQQVEDRPPVDYKPRLVDPNDPSQGYAQGEVNRCSSTWREPEGMVRRVLEDVEQGRSVMILASCGYMLEPTIAVLKRGGVPFWNPFRVTHGGWNPLRGARRLLSLLRPDPATWGDESRWYTWPDVRAWGEKVKAKGNFNRGAKDFIVSKARAAAEAEKEGEEPRLVNPATLAEQLASEELFDHLFEVAESPEVTIEWWENNLLTDAQKASRYPIEVYRSRGGAALRESPRIVTGTIHSVKGGQADSVYVFPDLSHKGWSSTWERPSTRAPSYRLFYVAFTRAREKLTLCDPAGGEAVSLPVPEVSAR
jgi:superfamily I DNA/RNA helicase